MRKALLILLAAGFLTGCSIEANVSELFPKTDIGNWLSKTQGAEFVSGSSQYQTTTGVGYKVQVSVGNYVKDLKTVTPSEYTVFSSIQGDILSDQLVQ